MKKIIFVRHGESTENIAYRQGITYDTTNIELTDNGKEQARKTGVFLKNLYETFDIVYSSPLKRCIQTANIICNELNYPFDDVNISDKIIEVGSMGSDLFGLSYESKKILLKKHPKIKELKQQIKESTEPFKKYELTKKLYKYNREKLHITPNNREVKKNIKIFLEKIKENLNREDIKNILIICHGGTMNIIQNHICNLDNEAHIYLIDDDDKDNIINNIFGNCACLYIGYKNEKFKLISPINCRHLITKINN